MSSLPDRLAQYLLNNLLSDREVAHVKIVDDRVVSFGGQLDGFGLDAIHVGDDLERHLPQLPLFSLGSGEAHCLPRLEIVAGRSTDIHVVPDSDGVSLLFVDSTADAARERTFQQRGNEWSLFMRAWGVAAFEQQPSGEFCQVGISPPWLTALQLSDSEMRDIVPRFPLLESYIEIIGPDWSSASSPSRWSDMWQEEDSQGRTWYLTANATSLDDGRRLLFLRETSQFSREHERALQGARDKSLNLARLQLEIAKKEILLHCIIHDLRGPLTGMTGSMDLLSKTEVSRAHQDELLAIGIRQAKEQDKMITGLLDAFVADVEELENFESTPGSCPDLLHVLRKVTGNLANAFESAGVAIDLSIPSDLPEPVEVCSNEPRLDRVFANLLGNALRHSPEGGQVTIHVVPTPSTVRVLIEDEGPGVPPDLVEQLFQKFTQGRDNPGTGGLGLYYCRTTIEKWGGAVGYEDRATGGASFWVELQRPSD